MGNHNRTLPILTLIDQRPGTSLTCEASDIWYGKIFSEGGYPTSLDGGVGGGTGADQGTVDELRA